MTEYLICPFCKEDDFDLIGLKTHLWCNHCEVFNKTEVDTTTMADLLHLNKERKMKVNLEIAKICHQVNRDYCIDEQLVAPPKWDELPLIVQESIIADVAEVIADPKISPTEIHEKWMEYKASEGWKFGEVKDFKLKTHPNLVMFKDLPGLEKRKDFLFIRTVRREMKK